MGCSWISVVSLAVLVFASYMANMKAITYTISTESIPEESTVAPTPTSPANQQPIETSTSETVVPNCQLGYNESDSTNITQPSNCTNTENVTTSTKAPGNPVAYRNFPEYTHYKNLGKVAPYLSNLPGFVFNILTILVAINIRPLYTSEIYMITLGFADLIAVTVRFIYAMVNANVKRKALSDCQLLLYVLAVAQMFSNLILVAWTVERFIAVIFPIKLASWCSIRNTKISAVLLLLFSIAISVPHITENGLIELWNGIEIINTCTYTEFMLTVLFHVESVCYIYIPMLIVSVCNIAIICRLSAMTKARISMASNQELINKKSQENKKMTILLLTISGTFLLLHIPYAIAMIINYFYPDITVLIREDPHAFAKFLLYTNCGYFITEFQNSINFFLYCISGTKFRSTFVKLFCRHIAPKKGETTQESATRTTTS